MANLIMTQISLDEAPYAKAGIGTQLEGKAVAAQEDNMILLQFNTPDDVRRFAEHMNQLASAMEHHGVKLR